MLRIRLRRTGRSKAPQYRVVIADQRAPRDGDFVEIVGHYNPRANPKELVLKEERIRHWLSEGARPSETVHRLLHREGLMEEPPRQRHTVASRAEREAATATAAAEAEAAAEAPPEAAAPAAEAPSDPAPEAEAPSDDASSDGASEPEDPPEATDEPPEAADESEAEETGEAGADESEAAKTDEVGGGAEEKS